MAPLHICTFAASSHLVFYILLGGLAPSNLQGINTIFHNETVLERGSVELTVVKPLPSDFTLIACGISHSKISYGYITRMVKNSKTFKVEVIRNKYKGRISVKDGLTTVISNITYDDEGHSFYCGYMPSGESSVRNGKEHRIKSVQVIPRIYGAQLKPTTQAEEGKNLTLLCQFIGRPLNLSWSGSLDLQGTITKITKGDIFIKNISLYTAEVKQGYHGKDVSCMASDHFGSVKQSTKLNVIYPPKNVSLHISHKWLGPFAEVRVECKASSNPNVTSYKYYKGETLVMKSKSNVYRFKTSTCTAIRIRCVPVNALGDGDAASQTLTFARKPSMVSSLFPKRITVKEGDRISLLCNATGCPLPTITWYKRGSRLSSVRQRLVMNQVLIGNHGFHTCVAQNKYGIQNISVYVDVQYSPRDLAITSSAPNNMLKVGQPLSIACNSRGSPKPFYSFYHRNKSIGSSFNGTMAIIKANCEDHRGAYACKASNKLGIVGPVKIIILCPGKESSKGANSMARKTIVILVTVSLAVIIALSSFFVYMFKRWNRNRQVSPSKDNSSSSVFQDEKLQLNQYQTPNNTISS